MDSETLLKQIGQKESDKGAIAEHIIGKREHIGEIVNGSSADDARTRYGCEKVLRIISEREPSLLYPEYDFFVKHLDSDNSFLKWGAIIVIANLAAVDSGNKIEKILDTYLAPIPGPVLITAANVIKGACKIASVKPALAEKITEELLKVEKATYKTAECRNIAIGHAITSFDRFFDRIEENERVVGFIKRQLENTRSATRKKAEKFIKKHDM